MLFDPLRWCIGPLAAPGFTCVIFRRTYPQITNPGGLWDESLAMYAKVGGKEKVSDLTWQIGCGKIQFAHMQHEADKYDWQGSQIAVIDFDELTHFSEAQFWYMVSRNRSTCGVRPYVRATTNPDPDSWVAGLIAWWIGEDGYPIAERAGVLRWFVRRAGELIWADSAEELVARFPTGRPKSLTFIPAKLEDNKILEAADPDYRANLEAQDEVERARLLEGNWKVRAEAGRIFDRANFRVVERAPAGGVLCRGWDFAATEKQQRGSSAESRKKRDPDYTAGVLIKKVDGAYYMLDVIDRQAGPAQVDRLFVEVTGRDKAAARAAKARYRVQWEIEPGSAGVNENERRKKMIDGCVRKGVRATGDKLLRASALADEVESGNVYVVRGDWTERFLSHMHHQPDLPHDDIMDAAAVAFNALRGKEVQRAAAGGQRRNVIDYQAVVNAYASGKRPKRGQALAAGGLVGRPMLYQPPAKRIV